MKKTCISLLFCLLGLALKAVPSIRLTPIPSLPQLPVSAIHRIFQDSEGIMWYGTVNGLCRDDGYQVDVIRSDINTPGLLNNNTIQSIGEDAKGRIWFGTDHGAYILDKSNGKVTPLDARRLQKSFVFNIRKTSDGCMWVATGNKILRYDAAGMHQKTYYLYDHNGKPSWMAGFCESRQKQILITLGKGGIYHYDKKLDTFIRWASLPANQEPTTIIQDQTHNYFWVGTVSNGVLLFNPSAPKDSIYIHSPLPINPAGEKKGTVLYLVQDHQGTLWMTTQSSLVAMRYDEERHVLFQTDFRLPSPYGNMLNEIYKDKNGALWVASFDGKSFIVHFTEDAPEEFPLPALKRRIQSQPAIMALSEAGEGKIWISQERTGLALYDLMHDNVSLFTDFPSLSGLPLGAIKEMAEAQREGNVWVVPEGYNLIYEFCRNGMQIDCLRTLKLPSPKRGEVFTQIHEDEKEVLWAGTNNGLYTFDLHKNLWHTLCDTLGQVSAIQEDRHGNLWIGTSNKGLYVWKSTGESQKIPSPRSVTCLSIQEDSCIWIGTQEGGVYALDLHTRKLTDHTHLCGLTGNIVNQLEYDVYGHLWIDTNQKLIEYNPRNHSFSTYLTTDNSMMLHRFIPTAICKGHDGQIYFGGIPGICAVTPSARLDQPSQNIPTFLTGIYIMGKRMPHGKSLTLQPDEHDLEIHFSSLDYLNARKIRYAYRLKGLDKEWNYTTEGQNSVNYKHLPKGNYVFEVKATDNHGVWSEKITNLQIERLPAFYQTGWAITFYLLLAATGLSTGVYLYLRRMKRKSEELYADSTELMKMRSYLDERQSSPTTAIQISDKEFAKLDEILLDKILKAVEENLSEPDFDVQHLAEKVNMSRSTLTRKLKAITGLTPLEYIRRVKMQHACRMLKNARTTVNEVALALGYYNRKYFTSCFKEEYGMTPSEYQKQQEKKGTSEAKKG